MWLSYSFWLVVMEGGEGCPSYSFWLIVVEGGEGCPSCSFWLIVVEGGEGYPHLVELIYSSPCMVLMYGGENPSLVAPIWPCTRCYPHVWWSLTYMFKNGFHMTHI